MKNLFLFLLLAGIIAGCQEEEPKIPEQQKDNLVENQLSYHNYKDSVSFHQVTKIFVHSQLIKIIDTSYSLPTPGYKVIKVEDSEGNEKDSTVAVPYGISFNAKEVK